MPYHIAFDRDKNLEFILYKSTAFMKDMFCTTNYPLSIEDTIGTFLLMFLNTDFENFEECSAFIYHFCFANFYCEKYPNKVSKDYFYSIKLTHKDFLRELRNMVNEEQSMFLYIKHMFLKNLQLPYNEEFLKSDDEEDEENSNLENNSDVSNIGTPYNLIEINNFLENVTLDFDLFRFLLGKINIYKYNVPYGFYCDNIFSILGLEFKEFMSCKKHTIRKCQNCGQYFIPHNLKETKYCNELFEETGKTCKQIGKELAYRKSLQEDSLLDKYRKRYMSLASSVSHYGTDRAIEKFEKYKKDGAIMKKKYLNKEITPKEFEKWIESTKK